MNCIFSKYFFYRYFSFVFWFCKWKMSIFVSEHMDLTMRDGNTIKMGTYQTGGTMWPRFSFWNELNASSTNTATIQSRSRIWRLEWLFLDVTRYSHNIVQRTVNICAYFLNNRLNIKIFISKSYQFSWTASIRRVKILRTMVESSWHTMPTKSG